LTVHRRPSGTVPIADACCSAIAAKTRYVAGELNRESIDRAVGARQTDNAKQTTTTTDA
jgi:hypothetical protein